MDNPRQILDISWQSWVKFFAILILIVAAVFLRQIIMAFLAAVIFASVFEIPIRWLSKRGISRVLATVIVYFSAVLLVGFSIYFMAPSLVEGLGNLYQILPDWFNWEKISSIFSELGSGSLSTSSQWLGSIVSNFGQLGGELAKAWGLVSKLFGGIFYGFIILLLGFYINIDKNGIERLIKFLTPASYENYAVSLWERWQKKIGYWFYSQLVMSLIMAILIFAGLALLKIKYALLLALVMAFLDFIPYIGPIVAAACGALLSAEGGYITVLLVLLLYTVVQQLENIIAPPIRGKIIKINPILIIVAVILGGQIFGFLGVILAIPILALAIELARDIKHKRIVPFAEQERLL